MTEREEIDMLRREVADLRERLRALEARPAVPVYAPVQPLPAQPGVPYWLNPVIGGTSPNVGIPVPPWSYVSTNMPPWSYVSTNIGAGPRPGDTPAVSWG